MTAQPPPQLPPGAGPPLPPPTTSPDGKNWWNGYQWVPLDSGRRGHSTRSLWATGCVSFLMGAFLLYVFLVIAARVGENAAYCQGVGKYSSACR